MSRLQSGKVSEEEVRSSKGMGMLLRKQWDSYTQTSIVMQISSSMKLPTVATKSALGNKSD